MLAASYSPIPFHVSHECFLRIPSWNVTQLAQEMAAQAAVVWEINGRRIEGGDIVQVGSILRRQDLGSLRHLWSAIPYSLNQTAYPQIGSPSESVSSHIEGLLLLNRTWGSAVAECWREGDFFEKAESLGIPTTCFREPIGREFSITTSPGSHETAPGVDYRLQWHGRDATGTEREVLLSTVGFIRWRDGLGVTLLQGGPRLTETKIARPGGKVGDLLKLVQNRFEGDPRAWLLRDVVRRLRRDHPGIPIYWLRAERRAPLYAHITDPDSPTHESLFAKVGLLSLPDLERLVTEAAVRSGEAIRLPFVTKRLNEIAASIGFRETEGGDAWWVLPH